MKKRIKKRWIAGGILVILLYLALGAILPFLAYKDVSEETRQEFQAEALLASGTGCDRAMLLETSQSAWEERIRLLDQAQERIILSTFDMREGESTRDLLAVILHKADEGVSVQIVVDGISGVVQMKGNPLFYALSSHPKVQIKLYNRLNLLTPWKSQGRMHDKYIIVDQTGYILGGRNTFDYFIGNYENEHNSLDREVLIYNTEAASEEENSSLFQVEQYFKEMWNHPACTLFYDDEALRESRNVQAELQVLEERYQTLKAENPELFEDTDYNGRTVPTEGVWLLSNPTGLYGKEPVLFYELMELMKQAKERVLIHTPYAVCNSYMYKTLEEVGQQVPDMRILLNSVENGDNFAASSDYLRNKDNLLDTGIALYEYDGGISYHGKSVVIDGNISVIGSYNLDLRSTYVDTELMLVVKSEALTEELAGYMQAMEQDCRKVLSVDEYETPEHITVQEIPWWKRLALYVAGLFMQIFRFLL